MTTTTTTDADGRYVFELTSLQGPFSVVFARAWNTHIYTGDEIASWAWLDGTALSTSTIEVADLEIGLQSFGQDSPPDGKTFSVGQISSASPIVFEWTPYPGATRYWMDLGREGETVPVWQSSLLTPSPSASFDGILDDETNITAGTYWWNIGAQKNIVGGIYNYKMTVYGHPRSLIIEP